MKPCTLAHNLHYREQWDELTGLGPGDRSYSSVRFDRSGVYAAVTHQMSTDVDLWNMGSFPVMIDSLGLASFPEEDDDGEEGGKLQYDIVPQSEDVVWGDSIIASVVSFRTRSSSKPLDRSSRLLRSMLRIHKLDPMGHTRPELSHSIVLPFPTRSMSFIGSSAAGDQTLVVLAGMARALAGKAQNHSMPEYDCVPFRLSLGEHGDRSQVSMSSLFPCPGEASLPLSTSSPVSSAEFVAWHTRKLEAEQTLVEQGKPLFKMDVEKHICIAASTKRMRCFTIGQLRQRNKLSSGRSRFSLILCRFAGAEHTDILRRFASGEMDAPYFTSDANLDLLAPIQRNTTLYSLPPTLECLDIQNSPGNGPYYKLPCKTVLLAAGPFTAMVIDGEAFTALRILPVSSEIIVSVGFTALTQPYDRPDPIGSSDGRQEEERDPSMLGVMTAYTSKGRQDEGTVHRMWFWRPFIHMRDGGGGGGDGKEGPQEFAPAPAFAEYEAPPAPDGLDFKGNKVDSSVYGWAQGGLDAVFATCASRPLILAVDNGRSLWRYSRTMVSSFPGVAYPPGYEYMMRVQTYQEAEDELDKEVVYGTNDAAAKEARAAAVLAAEVAWESPRAINKDLWRRREGDKLQRQGGLQLALGPMITETKGRMGGFESSVSSSRDVIVEGTGTVRLLETHADAVVPHALQPPRSLVSGDLLRDVYKRRKEYLETAAVTFDESHVSSRVKEIRNTGLARLDESYRRDRESLMRHGVQGRASIELEMRQKEESLARQEAEERRVAIFKRKRLILEEQARPKSGAITEGEAHVHVPPQ